MILLGQDDWLFYARRGDGVLVYTVTETDWHWLEAPHGGECQPRHRLNCDGEARSTCRLDRTWMHEHIRAHMGDYDWRELDNDTDGTYLGWGPERDEAFMASSRAANLID